MINSRLVTKKNNNNEDSIKNDVDSENIQTWNQWKERWIDK